MKINVSKTFQKVLALVLCAIMVFGAAPLASFLNASAEETYSITYWYYATENGESEITTETVTYTKDAVVEARPDPERIGHTFIGWDPAIPVGKTLTENMSITAQWDINQYEIRFVENYKDDAEVYEVITENYDTTIRKVADPVKTGYSFGGWDKEIPKKMPAENMTIAAQWTINQYTITFDTDGGSAIDSITQDYGTSVTEPAAPTKTGYVFAGWDKEIPATMPAENITLKAVWTLDKFTINFETGDNATEIQPITQEYNSTIAKPGDPTRPGYTFAGWDPIIPPKMPAENMTITAKWNPNTVNITLDPNGGTVINEEGNPTQNPIVLERVVGADADNDGVDDLNLPANPTRTGYTFMGWKDTTGEGGNYLTSAIPTESKTYYAIWKEGTGNASYTVAYYYMDEDGNYPDPGAPDSFAYYSATAGEEVDIYDEVVSEIELGYELDTTNSTPVDLKGTATSEDTLEFKVYIARKTYKIEFDSNGGSEVAVPDKYYGQKITAPEAPTKVGYTFAGWKNNSTDAVENLPAAMPAANLSYTAQWTKNTDTKYKVVINYNDATKNGAAATKEYSFAGTTGGKVKILIDGTAADDGAIYHKLSDFTLEHYKFDTSVMDKQQFEGTIAADGSTLINLYFIPVEYKVTFVVTDKVISTESVKYYTDANDVKPSTEEIEDAFAKHMAGYSFKAWEPKLSNVTGDITYSATYTPNIYEISFDYKKEVVGEDGKVYNEDFAPNAGTEVPSISQDFNTDVKIPDVPAKNGYTCNVWVDKDNNQYKGGTTIKMPVDGLELTAIYVANAYTITFDTNLEGATLKTKSVTDLCDDYVEIVEDMIPSKEGYTFLGWYDYTDKNNPVVYNLKSFVRVPANNLTLVAEWAVGEFAIICKDNTDNGKIVATYEDVASDAAIKAPDYPAKSDLKGRTFLGWREEGKKAGDPLFVFDKMPGHSIILEAVWGYTITFDINTEDTNASLTSAKTSTKEIGVSTDMSTIKAPTRTGHSFTGWYSTKELKGTPVTGKVSYSADTTLYAGWSINAYSITLIADSDEGTGVFADGTKKIVISDNYNEKITAPANPTKTGYTFVGWKDQNGNSVSAVPANMPTKNMVLTAQWTINSYSVVFVDPNGSVYKSETLTYGSKIEAPENPSKIGCTFIGWNKAVPETVPAYDLEIKAVWKTNVYTITFRDVDGKVFETVSYEYGAAVRGIEEPSKWFYRFTGWDKDLPETMPAEDLVFTATWERQTGFFDYLTSLFMSFFSFLTQIIESISDLISG